MRLIEHTFSFHHPFAVLMSYERKRAQVEVWLKDCHGASIKMARAHPDPTALVNMCKLGTVTTKLHN
jgi:hypothetical protein